LPSGYFYYTTGKHVLYYHSPVCFKK